MHKNCISDPLAKAYWRDFQHIIKDGNPLGLSFVEYVAQRVRAEAPTTVTSASGTSAPWYVAVCGHRHVWGESCGSAVTA